MPARLDGRLERPPALGAGADQLVELPLGGDRVDEPPVDRLAAP